MHDDGDHVRLMLAPRHSIQCTKTVLNVRIDSSQQSHASAQSCMMNHLDELGSLKIQNVDVSIYSNENICQMTTFVTFCCPNNFSVAFFISDLQYFILYFPFHLGVPGY